MIVLYAIGAVVLGLLGFICQGLASLFCFLAPWDAVHWINVRMLALAEATANWPAINLLRKAAQQGRPYVACQTPAPDGTFVKLERFVYETARESQAIKNDYAALRLIAIELTGLSGDEIDGLVTERHLGTLTDP